MWPRSHAGIRLPRELVSRLNRIFGEINAALIAIAIGLAVLDYLCLVRWEITAMLSQ